MSQFKDQCKRFASIAALLTFALLLMQSVLYAQQTGTITGTVQDSTGAVIPGAKIKLANAATHDLRESISNAEGFFVFAGVVSGTYDVRIDAQGFRSWEKKGIDVQPGDKRTVGAVSLTVGAAGEVVTVESTGTGVDIVASGDRASLLTPENIKNLALEGRDVTELLKVLPGFSNTTGGGGLANTSGYNPMVTSIGSAIGNGYAANGAPNRAGGVDLMADGAHVIDPGCNCNSTQTINADMVQEVKVATSTFGADSANGPVVVQAVGKSGGSEYHGSAYMHFRDSSMFSNDAGLKAQSMSRPSERYWYPGGQFGGPIPGTNKKITFFTGFEYYNQNFPDTDVQAGLLQAVVPTASMRKGFFDPTLSDNAALCSALSGWHPACGALTDSHNNNNPGTGFYQNEWGAWTPVTNSDISAYLDPSMVNYVNAMFPMPNTTPTAKNQGYNYQAVMMDYRNGYMHHDRVDFDINQSTKLYVSYNLQKESTVIPIMQWWTPTPALPFPGKTNDSLLSHTLSGNLVKTLSPTTTNEFKASFARMHETVGYGNYNAVSRSAQNFAYKGIFGNAKTLPSLTRQWWIPDMPNSFQADNNGYSAIKLLPSFSDDLTKVVGTHTFKFGLSWERNGNQQLDYQVNWAGTNGQVAFGPYGATANPIANMMLGMSTAYAEVNKQVLDKQALWGLGFYGQDDWKATKRLTLTFGMRFTHDTSWTDSTGKTGNAVWYQNLYAADIAAGNTTTPGLRWHGIDKSVPLSGRKLTPMFYMPRFGLAYDLLGNGKAYVKGGVGLYYFHDQWNTFDGALATASGMAACTVYGQLSSAEGATSAGCAASPTAIDPKNQSEPKTLTYNFALEYQTSKNTLLSIAYSGNQSSDLLSPLTKLNAVPLNAMVKNGVMQVDPRTGATPTMSEIENNSDGFNKNDYRPYTAYDGSFNLIKYGAWANYHALQISWNKPRGRLTYGLNYTWSKTLGISSNAPDPINIHNDYGIMNTDRPHVLNATYSYDTGKLVTTNKFLGGVLNNWMVSGITSIQSGAPVPQSWRSNLYLQSDQNSSAYPELYYDNIWVLGSPDYTLMPKITCNINAGVAPGSHANPACFQMPSVGTQGTYQYTFRGPVYWNSDLALQKTFKITEHQNAQFRISAFNFMNHALPSYLSCEDCGGGNLNLYMVPTGGPSYNNTTYRGYTGGFALQAANQAAFSRPEARYGRRVVELSFKYNF